MSEKLQNMLARTKVLRRLQEEANPRENITLKENLEILAALSCVVKNNPQMRLIEIIGKHIAGGMPLDEWSADETY